MHITTKIKIKIKSAKRGLRCLLTSWERESRSWKNSWISHTTPGSPNRLPSLSSPNYIIVPFSHSPSFDTEVWLWLRCCFLTSILYYFLLNSNENDKSGCSYHSFLTSIKISEWLFLSLGWLLLRLLQWLLLPLSLFSFFLLFRIILGFWFLRFSGLG